MALFMVKTWMGNKVTPIYGAEWAGGSDPSWSRTDDAVGFSAPNPYYSGMSTTPSSPFDNIMPWSGMRRVTDASAGELVEIPKFYYKWTRDGVKMKLQISMSQFDGSHVSPAHADRGDGVGERDYVYVGRYHCSSSNYKSASGVTPKVNITRATARTNIHNLGSSIWQLDFAMYWTINMLYLVEFASWNSQAMIGYGCGNNSSLENNGASDTMPYHTGTMKSSRSTYGVGVQYRYVENWWANAMNFVDGIYFAGSSNVDVYCIKNPANFSDTSGGTKVGTRSTTSHIISKWTNPNANGFEYALYPSECNGSDSTYVCDYSDYSSSAVMVGVGGGYSQGQIYGAFCLSGNKSASSTTGTTGTRLMVLPSSRLSA